MIALINLAIKVVGLEGVRWVALEENITKSS